MFKKFKLLLLLLGVSAFSMFAFNSVAFAEDDNECSGIVTGKTDVVLPGFPPDEGQVDFDCHLQKDNAEPDGGLCPNGSDMSKVPEFSGICGGSDKCYAPERSVATCIASGEDADTFLLKGFAWNNNLNFVSFYCGEDGKNLGIDCGDISFSEGYGVTIGPKQPSGVRNITGHAWSPTYGWISFNGPFAGGGKQYGLFAVEIDAVAHKWVITNSGDTVPYAYTNAGAWINFQGIEFTLPGAGVCEAGCCPVDDPECCLDGECDEEIVTCGDDKFYVDNASHSKSERCSEIFNGEIEWVEGYENGFICKCPKEPPLYCDADKKLCLNIEMQVDGDSTTEYPLADGDEGYEIYLLVRDDVGPVTDKTKIEAVNFNSWVDKVKANQIEVTNGSFNGIDTPIESGGGIKNKPISLVTADISADGLKTVDGVEFGKFLLGDVTSYAPTTAGNTSWTEEQSSATSSPIKWENEYFVDEAEPLGFVEGKDPNTLTLGVVNVKMQGIAAQNVPPSASGTVSLNFRPAVTFEKLNQGGKDSITGIRDLAMDFYIKLFKGAGFDPSGLALNVVFPARVSNDAACTAEMIDVVGLGGVSYAADDKTGSSFDGTNIGGLLAGVGFSGTPKFVGEDSCMFNKKSSVYTTVQYAIDGKTVKYYSNKLPKTFVNIINPSVNILGNVRAQKAAVTNKEVLKISAVGGQVVFKPEKGSMLANIASYGDFEVTGGNSNTTCNVSKQAGDTGLLEVLSCNPGTDYSSKTDPSTSETIFYFKNVDVNIDLGPVDCDGFNYKGKYVFVVDEGNVYVNSDVYSSSAGKDNQISIAVLSKDPKTLKNGNLYVSCGVKNTQFAAYLDNSLFQYFDDIDYDGEYGEPSSPAEYFARLSDQTQCSQWKHEGAFISYNTIGGMGDKLIGRGYQTVTDPAKAQLYDLNYQRLIFATFKTVNGKIVDMYCGKPFEFADYKDISNDDTVCSTYCDDSIYVCNSAGCGAGEYKCNGINGAKLFHKQSSQDGDLWKPPSGSDTAACGLENEYGPGYIYQTPNYSSLFKGMFTTKR